MSLKRNVIANFLGQGWAALMGIAFLPVYIRLLGIEAYGLIGVYALMQAWLALLDMGITPTLNREMARFTAGGHTPQSIRNLLRSLEVISFGVALLIGTLVWLCSSWLASEWFRADALSPETVAQAIVIMGWIVALRSVEGLYRGALLGLQQQVLFNIVNSVLATVRWVGAIAVLLWWSPSINVYFVWQGLVSVVTVSVLALVTKKQLPLSSHQVRFTQEAIAGVWRFAGGMAGIAIFNIVLTQIDKVLLSRLLPLQGFGYYAFAATLSSVGYMIVGPVVQATYPRMVEHSTNQAVTELSDIYHKGSQLVTVVTAPVMLLLSFFAGGVVFAWSGQLELAQNTAPILTAMALGVFLNVLLSMPYYLQLAAGWTSLSFKATVIALFVFVPVITWVVPKYGAVGAAWTIVFLYGSYILFSIHFMHRKLITGEKWNWYVYDVLIPSLSVSLYLFVVYQFRPEMYSGRVKWIVFLMFNIAISFLLSLLSARSLRPMFFLYISKCLKVF